MKATIISPMVDKNLNIGICTVIPFETLEVSISFDNGVSANNKSEWCSRVDARVFDKKTDTDITVNVLGSQNNYPYSGYDVIEILNKAKAFDEQREEIKKITCKGMPDFEVQVLTRKNQTPKLKWFTNDILCEVGEEATIKTNDGKEIKRVRVK